jgi:TPR repeat protein
MRATNFLAMLYFTGRGVTTKLESAHDMFQEASRGGNGHAYNNIALCLERGYGTDVDIEGAYQMYLRGALLGSPESMYSLGFLSIKRVMETDAELTAGDIRHLPDGKKEGGLEMANSTAEAVQLVRYVTLEGGSRRRAGDTGRDALLRSGVRWMRRAAEMAVAEAGYQLGLLYEQVSHTRADTHTHTERDTLGFIYDRPLTVFIRVYAVIHTSAS